MRTFHPGETITFGMGDRFGQHGKRQPSACLNPHISHFRATAERSVLGNAPGSGAGFGGLAETAFPSQMQEVRGSEPLPPAPGPGALPRRVRSSHRKV